ncbi:MAG: PIN-like domain-containing protein [Thermoanaerobaculia bacterium]
MSRVYFTDRDLGRKFPAILSAAGLAVERHDDFFAPAGSDEEWLEYCGRSGRIAVTHDARIRYKPNELAAVVRHGVALLVVVGHAPFPELAQNFVNTIDRIEAFVSGSQPPYIAKIYRPSPTDLLKNPSSPGSIVLWHAP